MKSPQAKGHSEGPAVHNHAFFAAMACPSQVTWTNDIQKLFTPTDIDHMKAVLNIDLGNYQSVKINAVRIYSAVSRAACRPRARVSSRGHQPGSTRSDVGSSKTVHSRPCVSSSRRSG